MALHHRSSCAAPLLSALLPSHNPSKQHTHATMLDLRKYLALALRGALCER